MSLLVHAFVYDENNEMRFVKQCNSEDLAGFESCRKNLYGNDISNSLGLEILPVLSKESDVFVGFENLDALKKEVKLMLDNLDLYEKEKIYEPDYIVGRLNNILQAIEIARKVKGQVVI